MNERDDEVLERLVVGSVAITERAIAASGTDLTFVQWRVLLIVGERPGGATVGEIAARIGARGSPASRLISRLKARGVVQTEKDPADGRIVRVQLTDSGRSLRTRVLKLRRADLRGVSAAIALSEPERDALRKVARALASLA